MPPYRALGLALLLLVGAVQAQAKGNGRAFFLDGIVSDVRSVDGFLEFELSGSLLVETCERNECSTDPWAHDAKLPIRVDPAGDFFAMGTGWGGGALRDSTQLEVLLRRSENTRRSVRIELGDPRVHFANHGRVVAIRASVHRITDHELR